MAGQGMNRREALKAFALAAAASQFAGFEKWAYAHEHTAVKRSTSPYKPKFFNQSEFLTITVLSDLIIPTDETAGAKEAGCAEFTDFIISHDPDNQPHFRKGLEWLDRHARTLHKKSFTELSHGQQTAILETLSYPAQFREQDKAGQDFFKLIRTYTVMGYYTSRAGMEALGVPTLQHYSASPECPHHDDPEHKHLQKAKA